MSEFAAKVWDTLSSIDVGPHVEEIEISGGKRLSYVPWHKAWMLLKRLYPASTYRHGDDVYFEDGTMEVEVFVTIQCGTEADPEDCVFTSARLGVMDNRYNAIAKPNARQINDNRQRALVKALAFAGLGLSLWDAGSTTPVAQWGMTIDADQAKRLTKQLKEANRDVDKFLQWAGVEKIEDLTQEKYYQARKMMRGAA